MDMIFNDIDFSNLIKVEQIRRHLFAPRIINSHKIPGKIGSKFSNVEMEPQMIEVNIRIIENTRLEVQEKVRELAGLLHTTEPKKLRLRDEPTRYNIAIVADTTAVEKLLHTGFTTLPFLCLDPLAYNLNSTKIPLDTTTQINNQGTYKTNGIITVNIDSNQNYLEVLQVETGEKVYIGHEFVSGDIVEINLKDEYVKKNNNLIMEDVYLISDFFDIPVGESTINLSSGTGTLEYQLRWL